MSEAPLGASTHWWAHGYNNASSSAGQSFIASELPTTSALQLELLITADVSAGRSRLHLATAAALRRFHATIRAAASAEAQGRRLQFSLTTVHRHSMVLGQSPTRKRLTHF